jgi:GH3 auxin-responsive promoter
LLRDLDSGELSVPLESGLRAALERALPARPHIARDLNRRFGRKPPQNLTAIWERLDLISCWTDGHAARALDAMRHRFPGVAVQPKGLLSTEGVVSFPLTMAGGSVAAVSSHFLELVPDDSAGEVIGVEDVELGRTYGVLLTTSGGLYRYSTKDLVRVEGWYRRAPVLTFVGRSDAASDLAGEKLTPRLVEDVIASTLSEIGIGVPFVMLAPVWRASETPHYALFVECGALDAERLATAVETRLREAHHYALCRDLGQLSAVRAVVVEDGDAAYERGCLARGQRAGSIKPVALDARLGWDLEFTRRVPASAVA